MSQNQSELFDEISPAVNPAGEFAQFRIGKKIIQVPCSFWKDGRIRADLSEFGAGEVVSRNGTNLQERVMQVLREAFGTIVEVFEECSRVRRPTVVKPRSNNKRPVAAQLNAFPVRYINPFNEKEWTFAKCPDWLFVRREPTHTEKRVYAKLLYPAPPICRRFDKNEGVIFGLDQGELAKALGVRRETANAAVKYLKLRGLIEAIGRPGARQVIKFLWHEWMPATCALNTQVATPGPVRSTAERCAQNEHQHVRSTRRSCADDEQLGQHIENRESAREKRNESLSSSW